jgi:phosphoribosyl-AMP cyclohydrolase
MGQSGKDFPNRLPAKAGLQGFLDALKFDEAGLVTVVVQDFERRDVLMVAHANKEAMEKTILTGLMHYYSRSRKKLWQKGEESGFVQRLHYLTVDCDGDAILAEVTQAQAACHLGFRSCFSFRLAPHGEVIVVGEKMFEPGEVYPSKKKKNK